MIKERGLQDEEVVKLLKKHGKNEIRDISKVSPLEILLRQIKSNGIIYLLLFAMIISFIVGKYITAWVIAIVIFVVITAGFAQEYRAEKAISSLRKMIMPVTIVIRNGKDEEIPSDGLVPGDIVILRNGERIPADCVILENRDLRVDESILSGESKEIKKTTIKNENDVDDKSRLFMGSFIINGKCTAKITATGMKTQFGKIAGMISKAEKELPLQKKLNVISKYTAIIGIGVAIVTGLITLLQIGDLSQETLVEVMILVIAVSVSAFPESLPVVLITTLSAGAHNMARKNAIVNRMSIIETLGETTIICSDKTGTITKGEMTVKKVIIDQREYNVTGIGYEAKGEFFLGNRKFDVKKDDSLSLLLKASVMCNDSKISRTGEDMIYKPIGSPTEAALLIMSAKNKLFKEDLKYDIEEEIPFSSERKQMTVLVKEGKERTIFSKGALEVVLKKSSHIKKQNGIFRLTDKDRKNILNQNANLTKEAFRTLAVAYKKSEFKDIESDLVFLGILALEDPPREEIREALYICKKSGIKVKMITGDNKETAMAISREIGLKVDQAIDGHELDSIDDDTLDKIINNITIFARVRPEHKLRIVKILKAQGEIVTMTGDGVNDAPALKEAHIGVAMGINGTDVSRSVADLTLKDDNFATIVDAIKEGRTIFNNIKKFVSYQLSCNSAELLIIFVGVLLAPLLGWAVPLLLAIHILFMNLVTSDLPAVTLGLNDPSKDIMDERYRKNKQILHKGIFQLIFFSGIIMALLTLGSFYLSHNIMNQPIEHSRTTALATLILLEIAGAFNFRSFRQGVFNRSPFVNKYLVYASIISILATLAIVYTPLNRIFSTAPIKLTGWLIPIGTAIILILIFDFMKRLNNKKHFWSEDENELDKDVQKPLKTNF